MNQSAPGFFWSPAYFQDLAKPCIIPCMTHEGEKGDKTRLIPLAEAARLYGYNPDYFGQLANRGRLKAEKYGPIWMTTLADVEEYLRSRQRRGVYREWDPG